MNEAQIPRGIGPLIGSNAMPVVSWFEFVFEDDLLEKHLSKENPEPSAFQLIVQFVQQAETERVALAHNAQDPTAVLQTGSTSLALSEFEQFATSHASSIDSNQSDVKVDSEGSVIMTVEENLKTKALKVLVLKVAAHLQWNLSALEKNVPIPTIQWILIELLRTTAPDVTDSIHSPDLEDCAMSDVALFAVQLFHRWCVRSVVRDSFPSRPVKQNVVLAPGQMDPNIATATATYVILGKFKATLASSIMFLEKVCQDQPKTSMPSPASFVMKHSQNGPRTQLFSTVSLPPEELVCQIAFDLGSMYFFEREYRKAFEKFRTCRQQLSMLQQCTYCLVSQDRLHGYLASCSRLLGVPGESNTLGLLDRVDACRKKGYQGISKILQEDNLKQELTMAYRNRLQSELSDKNEQLHVQVCLCNLVRVAMDGQTVVNPMFEALDVADGDIFTFFFETVNMAMSSSSQLQQSNLKSFLGNLIGVFPPESALARSFIASDVARIFSEEQLIIMAAKNEQCDKLSVQCLVKDVVAYSSGLPVTQDAFCKVSDVEGELLSVFDPAVIHDIMTDLAENRGMRSSQIIALNRRWKVPKEIRNGLDLISCSDLKKAYAHVLIAKACHCMDLSLFDRSRQLLLEADKVVAGSSYLLSKHLSWQVLLADILQYTNAGTFSTGTTISDLIKKTKTCLTSCRFRQDIQPSNKVLEHCMVLLLNTKDWEYVSRLDILSIGFIEMTRLLSRMCMDLPTVDKVENAARDLWDTVVRMYQVPGKQTHTRDAGVMMSHDAFPAFIIKLKEETVLSILMSIFGKLFVMLKNTDVVATPVSSSLFPSNNSSLNCAAVEDSLNILMEHALKVDPSNPVWLKMQAEVHFVDGKFSSAMKFYIMAGVVASDYFSTVVSTTIYDDQVYRRMIRCCGHLQCHTQVAVLCQFLQETDYSIAFKALQEQDVCDAMDAMYCCIWDVTMLEFLVHHHSKNREMDKMQLAVRAISRMDININNPEEIKKRAVHARKTNFLRSLANQYLA